MSTNNHQFRPDATQSLRFGLNKLTMLMVAALTLMVIGPLGFVSSGASSPTATFSMTPTHGPSGTTITLSSVTPCTAPSGSTNWHVVISQSSQVSSDAIATQLSTAPVGMGGTWSVTVTAKSSLGGSNGIAAQCTDDQGDQFGYVAQTFTLTTNGLGYWLLTAKAVQAQCFCFAKANVFAFGDAPYVQESAMPLAAPLVGLAADPTTGDGEWLVASDGGVFTFGDAVYYGGTGNITLNKPIVGMAATPDGKGYWLVASDGGVFTEGDAVYYGGTGNITLNAPITGMAAAAAGGGYWLVASDGGVFGFGNAPYRGSCSGCGTSDGFVGIAATPKTS